MSMTSIDPSRRRALRIAAVTIAGAGIAGCSAAPGADSGGGDGGDGGSGPDSTPTESSDGGDGDSGSDGDGSGDEWVETSTVEMTDELVYEPKRIQVEAGTTVTWDNVGNIGHTVTAYQEEIPSDDAYFASGGFDSLEAATDGYSDGEGNVTGGNSYEHTFETTGTYKYYCIPHEMNGMVGFVKVV
jgi:plastocyanin